MREVIDTPVSILFNLCPECRHARACQGPDIQPAPLGGITCASYATKPAAVKTRIPDAHVLALPDREPCADCACRKGSVPNRTHHSMADFEASVRDQTPFLCHAEGQGRVCAGWLRAVKARAAIEDAVVVEVRNA
jgi:hypothetical protein